MASIARHTLRKPVRRVVLDERGQPLRGRNGRPRTELVWDDDGKVLTVPSGEVWRAQYRDRGGRQRARHFKRKADAQRWLDEQTTALMTGTWVDPARARQTVDAQVAVWLENPRWKASTRARNRSIAELHVRPRWGTIRLVDVEHEEVQAWANELCASGMSARTVAKVVGVLRAVLALAVKHKRVHENAAAGVELPRAEPARRRYLTAAQVEALADAADEWRDLVFVLGYCGLRWGEAAALRVRDVDLLRRRLLIARSVTDVNGKLVESAPKDHQVRTVPVPAFVVADLEERIAGRDLDDVLWASRSGGPLRVRNFRRDVFDGAAAAAGVAGLTPHELRHTAASLAVSAGASVLAVQRMLGHEKPSMTLDVYADLFDADLDALADSLATTRARAAEDYLLTTASPALVAISRNSP